MTIMENKPQNGPSPWTAFLIASIAVFLISLDSTMLYAAFNTILGSFPGSSAADVSWVMNAYTIIYATMLIPAGGIAERFGRKKIFLFGVAVFLFASAVCGMATTIPMLISARVLQAIGAALLTPASMSIVLDAFPAHQRTVAVSAWGAVGALAAAIGPSLGSFIINAWGWSWAFYINLPLGMISLWKGAQLLQESAQPSTRVRFDLVGILLVIIGIGSIAFSIVECNSTAFGKAQLLALAATGLLALAGFVAWIRHKENPLIDPLLFADRTYRYVNVATFVYGIAFSMMFFGFFFYFTAIWHYSLPLAGLAITPGPLMVIPVAILAGKISTRIGHRPVLVTGSLVYAMSCLWYMLVPDAEVAYLTHWLPGLLLSGIGVGLVLPTLSAAAVHHLPANRYAIGSAVNQATRQIGSVLGVALTVVFLGQHELQFGDFKMFYVWIVAFALITGILCLAVNTRPSQKAIPPLKSGELIT
jgi:EmrB/QacA subfamily drug resistance transporter